MEGSYGSREKKEGRNTEGRKEGSYGRKLWKETNQGRKETMKEGRKLWKEGSYESYGSRGKKEGTRKEERKEVMDGRKEGRKEGSQGRKEGSQGRKLRKGESQGRKKVKEGSKLGKEGGKEIRNERRKVRRKIGSRESKMIGIAHLLPTDSVCQKIASSSTVSFILFSPLATFISALTYKCFITFNLIYTASLCSPWVSHAT